MPKLLPKEILDTGISSEHLVVLEEWGHYLANGETNVKKMTTSQIRRFFGEIKRIQADFINSKKDIILLDPKIAYAVGRSKKESGKMRVAIEEFYNQVSPLIRSIQEDEKKFKNFVHVCEAIVAYHRAKGGV
jgi:CRISPR-associated protein Csm2